MRMVNREWEMVNSMSRFTIYDFPFTFSRSK